MRRSVLLALGLAACVFGCRRAEEGVFVVAPFNDHTRLARVDARWATPKADGAVEFEVRVESRLADRLYVRLASFALTAADGRTLARSGEERSCVLAPKATERVLAATVRLPPGAADEVAGFTLETFGVPLSQRGQGIYREYLLQFRGRTIPEADAEIQGYQASPPCR